MDSHRRFDDIVVRCSVLKAELQERLVNMMIEGMTKYGRDLDPGRATDQNLLRDEDGN